MEVFGTVIDPGMVLMAVVTAVGAVALGCALSTDAGRRALAEVGIAFARQALRIAEGAADRAGDDRRRTLARAGLGSMRRQG